MPEIVDSINKGEDADRIRLLRKQELLGTAGGKSLLGEAGRGGAAVSVNC